MLSVKTKRLIWASYAGALLFWSFNCYGLLGQWYSDGTLFARYINGRPFISDFVNHYLAGALARQCLQTKISIYDRAIQEQYQKKLVAPVVPELPFYCQYPPSLFLFCLPLSYLSMPCAWLLWTSTGILLALLALAAFVFPDIKGTKARIFLIVAFVASFPTWVSVYLGQTSLFLLPLIALFFYLLRTGRYTLAGAVTCVAALKMQYLPFLAAIGLAGGSWSYLGGLVLGGGVIVTLCAYVVGVPNLLSFPASLLANEQGHLVSGVSPEKMQNIRGTLALLLGDDSNAVRLTALLLAAGAALALYFSWRRLQAAGIAKEGLNYVLLASASILVMLIFSPHTHVQDYILAVLPCAWTWLAAADIAAAYPTSKISWLVPGILCLPAASWAFFVFTGSLSMLKVQPYVIWSLFLLAAICLTWRRMNAGKTA